MSSNSLFENRSKAMFPDFLPSEVYSLNDNDAIFLTARIERHPISISLREVDTACVHLGSNDPPVLFLHGFDSSLLEFRHLIPLLTSKHEIWAVDLLGSGFTERSPDINYNPHTIKEHLFNFWQTSIKRPIILVGASMGGATAIDFTLSHPEAVTKLVLINSVGYSGSFPIGMFLLDPIIQLGVEFWRQRKIQSLFWGKATGLLDAATQDAIRCAVLPSLMPGWDRAIASFTRSGGYYQLQNRISTISKQTLILWGQKDDVLGTDAAEKFNKAIAFSKLVWLSEAGHSPHWEAPKLVAQQILEFIDS